MAVREFFKKIEDYIIKNIFRGGPYQGYQQAYCRGQVFEAIDGQSLLEFPCAVERLPTAPANGATDRYYQNGTIWQNYMTWVREIDDNPLVQVAGPYLRNDGPLYPGGIATQIARFLGACLCAAPHGFNIVHRHLPDEDVRRDFESVSFPCSRNSWVSWWRF